MRNALSSSTIYYLFTQILLNCKDKVLLKFRQYNICDIALILLFCLSFPGGDISFTGSGSSDWFDPNNWQSTKFSEIGLYTQQIPCQYDVVTFPKVSCHLFQGASQLSDLRDSFLCAFYCKLRSIAFRRYVLPTFVYA